MNVGKLYEMLMNLDRLSEKCEAAEDLSKEELRDVARYLKRFAQTLRCMEFPM